MTNKDHARFSQGGSAEDALGKPGVKEGDEHDFAMTGLKRGLEDRLRDLDALRPTKDVNQAIPDCVDLAVGREAENEGCDNFERLLREGSKSSRAKNAGQSNGCIPLLLIFSFIISLTFPLFWIVFVLLLLGVLASTGREWMG
ncbi:MAG: hypothetical protein QUV07_08590 [Cyanobium sp. CZS 25K]|nr:hypothetical protein [Cyanobium sp. CZS25K]